MSKDKKISSKEKIIITHNKSEVDLETGNANVSNAEYEVHPSDKVITLQAGSSTVTITPDSIAAKVNDKDKFDFKLGSENRKWTRVEDAQLKILQDEVEILKAQIKTLKETQDTDYTELETAIHNETVILGQNANSTNIQLDNLESKVSQLVAEVDRKADSIDVVEDLIKLDEKVSQKADIADVNEAGIDIGILARQIEDTNLELQEWKEAVSAFANEVNKKVDADAVVAAINNSPDNIRITGSKIEVDAYTLVEDTLDQFDNFLKQAKQRGKGLR